MTLSLVTQILRGYNYEEVEAVATVLCDAKYVKNLEVTLNTKDALETLQKISLKFSDTLLIGAGTVCTKNDLESAIKHGARFVLSPVMMSDDMFEMCDKEGVLSVPGAMSPSEIYQMYQKGAYAIKVFPSEEFSYSYAKKIKEPLNNVSLMAVGGVNTDNVVEYLKGSYDYIGTAGGIFKKEDIKALDLNALRVSLTQFEDKIDEYYKYI